MIALCLLQTDVSTNVATLYAFSSKTQVPVLKPLSEIFDSDSASQKEEVMQSTCK